VVTAARGWASGTPQLPQPDHPLATKAEVETTDSHEFPLVTIRSDFQTRSGEHLSPIFRVARIRQRVLHQTSQTETLQVASYDRMAALFMASARRFRPEGILCAPSQMIFWLPRPGLRATQRTHRRSLNRCEVSGAGLSPISSSNEATDPEPHRSNHFRPPRPIFPRAPHSATPIRVPMLLPCPMPPIHLFSRWPQPPVIRPSTRSTAANC
jgi:hypothetical protein